MKILVIANPTSGRGAAKTVLPKVQDFFEKNGVDADIYLTKEQNDATRKAESAAKSGKCDTIVVCGGDGTINEVLNGLVESGNKEVKFGIIPLGTENVLAQEMNIPFNPVEAAKVIISGKTKKIDIGVANGRYFVLMAGIGFDAHVASRVQPLLKKLVGSAAYPITAWNELFRYRHADLDILIDNRIKTSGSFVVIGNTKLYGIKLEITLHADISDGFLDVCIFKGKDVLSFLRYAFGMITKQHIKFSDIEYYKAKEVIVRSKQKVLCHVDCEVIGKTPVKVKVLPGAVGMIVT